MGYIKNEDKEISFIDGDIAACLREKSGQETFQPKKGDKFYVAGANGTVYSEKWFTGVKLMQHIALMRIGNVHPTVSLAKDWFDKYGEAFLENVNDL